MSRRMGWMMSMALGGALMAGCGGQQATEQAGRPNDPVHQKYNSPAGNAGEGSAAGQSGSGLTSDRGWSTHSAKGADNNQLVGPYQLSKPQPVPHERQDGPFGVGGGSYNARESAQWQLKKY